MNLRDLRKSERVVRIIRHAAEGGEEGKREATRLLLEELWGAERGAEIYKQGALAGIQRTAERPAPEGEAEGVTRP